MPSSARVEKRIWWLTVSYTEDKSTRMRTDEWDEALAAQKDSVTVRRAVSVESAVLRSDQLGSRQLFCER